MNILVLLGSPRQNGNSRRLARAFARGAEASGSTARLLDVTELTIHGCRACGTCHQEKSRGVCIHKDDMEAIYRAWREADAVVFATPLYFYSFSAQLKLVIDRTCALPSQASYGGHLKKLGLLCACQAPESKSFALEGLLHTYQCICRVWGLDDGGRVIAHGVHKEGEIEGHPALAEAYELGKRFGGVERERGAAGEGA